MPLVVALVIVSLLGHAVGAAGAGAWLGAAVVGAVAWAMRGRGVGVVAALVVVAGAGAVRASADRWRDAACARALRDPSAPLVVEVVPEVDARPGDRVPGRVRLPWCALPVSIRARVAVTGGLAYTARTPLAEGTRRLVAELREPRGVARSHDALARWRAAAARRIDERFGADAPLVRALVVADVHDLDDAMRTRWARAGLVHALSVSGLHVGIVASALELVARAARLPAARASFAAAAGVLAYVALIGFPAPAVRAGVMFAVAAGAKARQRPTSAWAVIALGGWLPVLVDPAVPLDLGWQLSVGGIAVLQCAGTACQRLGLEGGAWRTKLSRELLTGVLASAASAPLVAWHMGLVSLVAPLANIAAAPLFTVLQPTLFLALLLDPVAPAARLVAAAAVPVLRALDGVAAVAARPRWAAVEVAPSFAAAVLAGVVVAAGLAAVVRRHAGPPLAVAAGATAMLVWLPLLPPLPGLGAARPGALELHVLDVGQGDALALRTPAGRWVLVDAGPGPPIAPDAGRRVVLPHVRRIGGDVAALVLTHADLDHVGGAPSLLAALEPDRLVEPGFLAASGPYAAVLDSARAHGVRWERARPGLALDLDGVRLRVLAPDSAWVASQRGPNDASTILRVEYGEHAFLLVGDAEAGQERELLASLPPGALRADVLKLGHHGSRTSTTVPFLDAVRPRLALVSVGRGNRYGHPSPSVLAALAARGVPVFRTDVSGALVVRTDGRALTVTHAAGTWSLPSSAHAVAARGGASSGR